MTLAAAAILGVGLGVSYFGTLWLGVRGLIRRPERALYFAAGGFARFTLLGLSLALLSRLGADRLLAALGGLWLARTLLLARLGRVRDEP